ncbi:MAG: hypothetical protein U1F25_16260 [Rubrivivax sp.]
MAVAALAPMAVDKAAVAESMAAAVRARTVSGLLDPTGVAAEFERLHEHLRTRYPLAHATLQREVVGAHSLLYTWTGSDAKARPLALPAHQDVVPIAPGTERLWKKPPFAGSSKTGSCGAAARSTTRATSSRSSRPSRLCSGPASSRGARST